MEKIEITIFIKWQTAEEKDVVEVKVTVVHGEAGVAVAEVEDLVLLTEEEAKFQKATQYRSNKLI